MRLLDTSTLKLCEFFGSRIPPYAILSHRWNTEEVEFQCLQHNRNRAQLAGWYKIERLCSQARTNGWQYAWIDTCCIDKSSSTELSEAINSMFRWYQNAGDCYAYLDDVSTENGYQSTIKAFTKSKWFTRGWTLQEMLAPPKVRFFDHQWVEFGTRDTMHESISFATGIGSQYLKAFRSASIAQIFSWASKRETTRTEDKAYCLLGLLDVNMPLLYGEGEKAFMRLQQQIIQHSNDETIFAWESEKPGIHGLLSQSLTNFANSHNIIRLDYGPLMPYSLTNMGLKIPISQSWLRRARPDWSMGVSYQSAPLNCHREGVPGPIIVWLAKNHNHEYCRVGSLGRINDSATFTMFFGQESGWTSSPKTEIIVRQIDHENWSSFHGFQYSAAQNIWQFWLALYLAWEIFLNT